MIYITGDCHGDWHRFQKKSFPEQKDMTHDDYMIVCGDFGIWTDDKQERYELDELSNRSFTTLFEDTCLLSMEKKSSRLVVPHATTLMMAFWIRPILTARKHS